MTLPTFINDFFIILMSIVVEGIPFILIGALLSGVLEQYVTPERIIKWLPKKRFPQLLTMSALGNIMPVCECGNIPFARRLIYKKVAPALAITFLLAAPVFNPIVIAATYSAFFNQPEILWFRILFTLIIAISIGFIFLAIPHDQLLKKEVDSHAHHHHHHHGPTTLLGVIKKEFIEMTGIFLFGATIATAIQLFVPNDTVFLFNQREWISIIAMMLLAFVVSICSNVDAFFALAYAQVFPTSSILAFLVLGPMIDIKAIPMFRTIFKWKPIFMLAGYIFAMTFLLCYLYFLFEI